MENPPHIYLESIYNLRIPHNRSLQREVGEQKRANMSRKGDNGAKPLGFMKRLSPSVNYFEPPPASTTSGGRPSQTEPELILLLTWMGARESHIAKYVHEYRALFPSSRILVAQCPFTHIVMPFLAWMQIRAAVPILQAVIESEPSTSDLLSSDSNESTGLLVKDSTAPPRVLIHAFSNGGISSTQFLYGALKRAFGGGPLILPRHVFIFDSCPGTFKWRNTVTAVMQVVPRWTSPAIHVAVFAVWLFYRVVPLLHPRQTVNARAMRNPSLQAFEVRRTYLYGTDDKMIPPADVEEQAALAVEAGFHVRLERFKDATHVAIPMFERDRYWRAVKESWYGEEPESLTGVVVEGDGGRLEKEADWEVVREIKIIDHEKPIQEEAGILAGDIQDDVQSAVKSVEETAQALVNSTPSTVETAAKKAEQQPDTALETTGSKAEDLKADAYAAIEQGETQTRQIVANTAQAGVSKTQEEPRKVESEPSTVEQGQPAAGGKSKKGKKNKTR